MQRGKLVVLYGINNIGKSTQAKNLAQKLQDMGKSAVYLKYPIYELEPFGPMINEYLRKGNPHYFSPREIQMIYALNRTQYEPAITKYLEEGTNVVAEDYSGTGMAWGIGTGLPKEFVFKLNSHLKKEDCAILLDGKQFTGREETHRYEGNDSLIDRVRAIHLELGKELGWHTVSANDSIDVVQENVWKIVSPLFV